MTIDIIGAGIGGLTTALALQQKGINVRVYEQTDELKPVGAGIILANNAMQVYQKLGLGSAIVTKGNPISSMNITTPDLTRLSGINLKYFENKYFCQNIAIHRATLQQVLTDYLEPKTLYLGHKLHDIEIKEHKTRLRFTNGKEVDSQITIGADGLNSIIRKELFPNAKIRQTHQICWRGVVDLNLPIEYLNEVNEAWGKGDRFGFVQISPSKIYWFALKVSKKGAEEYPVERLLQYFSGYNEIIKNIIKKTRIENIHTSTIEDLKPIKKWYKQKVCLIGDAAHATTPNMGQGACQAIEDAYILAECLAKFHNVEAFSTFQKLRKPKVDGVVHTSWKIGKMAHWQNPVATALRNQLLRSTPEFLSRMQLDRLFKLTAVI